MPIDYRNIAFLLGPGEVGRPDDLETVVISFIDTAQRQLKAPQPMITQPASPHDHEGGLNAIRY